MMGYKENFQLFCQNVERNKQRRADCLTLDFEFDAVAPAPEVNPHTRSCMECPKYATCRMQFEGATGCSQIF